MLYGIELGAQIVLTIVSSILNIIKKVYVIVYKKEKDDLWILHLNSIWILKFELTIYVIHKH